MKNKLITLIILSIFTTYTAKSQQKDGDDSVFVKIDSTFVNIVSDIETTNNKCTIKINQSKSIANALLLHSEANLSNQKISGWRICIYRDNKQNSRQISSNTKNLFNEQYPHIPAYREYKNPYFYVYVGDFRTKHDAEKFKREIISTYPKAWIKKEEKINLPPL